VPLLGKWLLILNSEPLGVSVSFTMGKRDRREILVRRNRRTKALGLDVTSKNVVVSYKGSADLVEGDVIVGVDGEVLNGLPLATLLKPNVLEFYFMVETPSWEELLDDHCEELPHELIARRMLLQALHGVFEQSSLIAAVRTWLRNQTAKKQAIKHAGAASATKTWSEEQYLAKMLNEHSSPSETKSTAANGTTSTTTKTTKTTTTGNGGSKKLNALKEELSKLHSRFTSHEGAPARDD